MNTTRQYELVYVVSPDVTEEGIGDLRKQIEDIVSRFGGEIKESENWGRRKLAYEIGHHKEGTYLLELINGPGDFVKELNRRLLVTGLVIRHLIVRVDEERRIAGELTERRRVTRTRRRQARGLPPEVKSGEQSSQDREESREDQGSTGSLQEDGGARR